MSDLLRKKPRKIEKGVTVTPKTTFTMDELAAPPQQPPAAEKNPVVKTASRKAEKTTTVRVSVSMKNKLNAMVTMGLADSVDQLTDLVVDEYISSFLSKDEKKQLDLIYDMYMSKLNNK